MPKALCILGIAISALVLIVFGLDLVLKMPFNGVHKVMDIGFVICSGILGYLSWTTLREQI
ncbi:MAG: hypothetical protein PHO07_17155 [Pirellulales bacterium]|jgi:hypothetical protein|nr:hypothetical protein [Thermoguttaceae bacterium]MDD4788427.1 hypothetical protein [Pirellulales bacterium]MDD4788901.1 hypothetical protein [Pirellulales bacterium]MDI9445612.1 hypothetical protein [Planctomycetota bacterium]NLY99000.1 hypothetical protein [Pirellulaceae bacterium]